jgi:hypothetical protein
MPAENTSEPRGAAQAASSGKCHDGVERVGRGFLIEHSRAALHDAGRE